ncbi:ATP-binding protein [Paracoccus sp. 228]|uniref:ATP-binding protein n=1 Tax=Paracoccus sp. 228 TaxID=1192054 RepID=UPI0005E869CA|nr:ATP-binding protein [Paracoccus sp. 228]KIX18945.1 histidine kinase [Paracoccus sp. 228]
MAHLDEQAGLPRGALAALPLLLAPMVLGAAVLMARPGAATGTAAVIASTVAVAWYLLGGAVAMGHLARGLSARKALRAIRGEVATAADPIWMCDARGQVLFQNEAARTEFEDLTGRPVLSLIARLRADAEGQLADLTARALRVGNADLELAEGEILSLSCLPDAPLQIWSLHRAGVQPDGFELALAMEEDQPPADDFDAIPVALLRLATDGRICRANAAARHLLDGMLADEGQNLAELLEGPGRPLADWLSDMCAGRATNGTEMLRLRHPDSRQGEMRDRYFQLSLARDPAEAGRMIAVLTDASALKTLEAQFVQSQKMQAIGQLAGGVAHDFNNLLTAISGHCDLLMLKRDKGDPDYADLDQISQNANRAAALVGQLLAFSRKQTLRLETLDLRDTLADLTHLLNRLVGERVGLTITYDPALRAIRADKRQLEQVIMNLVVNARDAMPQGGDITVRTENLHLSEAMTRDQVTLPKGDYVRIIVRDHGCGIAPDHLGKIFEPFFTTKRTGEGTGLGLSTAYGIVKQTGGFIFCDSVLSEGTTFSLYFPAHARAQIAAVPAARPVPRPTPQLQTGPKATVLLVEDEAPVRAFAARALKLKGYDVLEAGSGEAALSLLEGRDGPVDIFVTDVVMPGMDGPTWVREGRRMLPSAKVIFMSGYTEDIFVDGQVPIADASFLAKPFTLTELTQMVEMQLTRPSGSDRLH